MAEMNNYIVITCKSNHCIGFIDYSEMSPMEKIKIGMLSKSIALNSGFEQLNNQA
jgi:hypothetical protein